MTIYKVEPRGICLEAAMPTFSLFYVAKLNCFDFSMQIKLLPFDFKSKKLKNNFDIFKSHVTKIMQNELQIGK